MAEHALTEPSEASDKGLRSLSPAYFSMVMATGIISIAFHFLELESIALLLTWINAGFYLILWVLFSARLFLYPKPFFHDLSDLTKAPGFLTIVAGTSVLGTQILLIFEQLTLASWLYYLAVLLWLLILYGVFTLITINRNKPDFTKGINGIWYLMVVATQSISAFGTLMAGTLPFSRELILFISLLTFLIGAFLYIIITTLIFYRLTFFELYAEEFAPPYWINMGAVAITTLAGSNLIINASSWEFLLTLENFLKGITLLFWSIGTWWIPIIIILGFWRHFHALVPFVYHPQYWGMIFPLGMYATCTLKLKEATGIPFLAPIPEVFAYLALFTWTAAILGLAYNGVKGPPSFSRTGRKQK